jgi:hypothetical protein
MRGLGRSHDQALYRFQQSEKWLLHQLDMWKNYADCMREYEELGHTHLLSGNNRDYGKETFYLPHHPVFKHNSSITKLRVMFDTSARSTNWHTLNDTLLIGPTVQQDLSSILLRFRTHQIAFTVNIEKMYQQSRVHPKDTGLQRILWTVSSAAPIRTYRLQEVTYGTSLAPYLATACLKKFAEQEREIYPQASIVL